MSAADSFFDDAVALLVEDEDAPMLVMAAGRAPLPAKLRVNIDCPAFLFDAAKCLLGAAVIRATSQGDFALANQADAALETLGRQPVFHKIEVNGEPER